MKLLLTGRPFVGKSHFARSLFGDLAVVSVGDELRKRGATAGLEKGHLASDGDAADAVLDDAMRDSSVLVVDGYPRSNEQAEHLLKRWSNEKWMVLVVEAAWEECFTNCSLLQLCPKCFKAAPRDSTCPVCGDRKVEDPITGEFVRERYMKTFNLNYAQLDDRTLRLRARDLWDGRASWILSRLGMRRVLWVKKLSEKVNNTWLPSRSYDNDAGFDLYSSDRVILTPRSWGEVPHDIAVAADPLNPVK